MGLRGSSDRYQLVEALFQSAADLPSDRREAFLRAECDGDVGLRAEINSLLEHYEAAPNDYLAQPLHDLANRVGDETAVPERIGSYRVVRRLGRGGMGIVFEATQEDPRRSVAVKAIRPGTYSADALRRFEFKTAFARPMRFRYELGTSDDGDPKQSIIWSDREEVRFRRPGVGTSRPPSITDAIGALDMKSKVPTNTISGLLMPDLVGGSFLAASSGLVLMGEQDIGRTSCHRIRGRDPFGLNFTVWIEKKRKVVRKSRMKFHGFESPVWIDPTFNARLARCRLRSFWSRRSEAGGEPSGVS